MRLPFLLFRFILIIMLFGLTKMQAQETAIYRNAYTEFAGAKTNFIEGNYSLAQKRFDAFIRSFQFSNQNEVVLMRSEAQFYHALAARKLNNANAELLLVKFVDENNSSPLTSLAYFELGQLYFDQELYRDAIACYNKVGANVLTTEQQAEMNFQLAYSLFTSKQFKDAHRLFSQIINTKNQYYYDANYYYGVISYFDNDYPSALTAFQRIEQNSKYDKALPYYIALIYYHQKQYDNLVAYASPKAKTSGIKYQNELNQLLGQTLFNQQKFAEALPYLEFYIEKSSKVRKEDLFQLGFTQYQLKRYEDAIKNFTQLNNLTDSIGQNAMYHLADCYLKTDEKAKARNAFEAASRLKADTVIREMSYFNYGKLSYELNFHNIAINVFREFIKQYPASKQLNEAKRLLSSILENTQNYADALEILESIPDKTPDLWRAYQRILYYRGVEKYNDRKYDEALDLFDKALDKSYIPDISALAYFWKGNIYYKQKKYDEAFTSIEAYMNATSNPVMSEKVNDATANYTMGYSFFKQKAYEDALYYFDKSVNAFVGANAPTSNKALGAQLYPDAILRSGDCNFMLKRYNQASERYDNIIKYKMNGIDYAYYQKGMLAGLIGEYDKKIDNLKQLTKLYPKSFYADDATYQIALTYVSLNNYQAAVETHQQLIGDFPESEYVPKSLVNLGLVYYNIGDYDRSLQFYELVLKRFPKNIEAKEAITGVRDVFVAQGDADGYVNFTKKFPGMEVSDATQDSIAYEIAETYYTKGDCTNAVKEFTKYLAGYSKGAYVLYAHFYRAQCYYSKQEYANAGKDYDYIVEQNRNPFTDQALDKGGRVALYINKDYNKAFTYYRKLYETGSRKELRIESLRGLVKSSFYLKKTAELEQYGGLLIAADDNTPDDIIEAYFFMGLLNYDSKNYAKARQHFQQVSARTTNEKGAQARYLIADIYFKQNDLDSANTHCFKVINETASQTHWVVKGYILLADIYAAKGELFQAKATLKSIIDNYKPEDELKKEARSKLQQLENKKQTSQNFNRITPTMTGIWS
ncbi:MAG: tetratricopeptide repeat protein [Sphingobacteriales bacterium]|nr:MAG: tetratricopeptide repeat protein [Sphingobacteriales bacterium]